MEKEKTDKLLTEAMMNPLSFERAESMFELIMEARFQIYKYQLFSLL